jgi:glycosyltransferase involved in cell wall biosynthesis
MKRIAVVTSDVPFVEGGHLTIARSTVQALKQYGYDSDLVCTPQNRFGRQLRAYLANRALDLEEDGLGRKIHQVISFRFPSYAVKHPYHVNWLNHRMREYYDIWEVLYSQLGFKGKIREYARRFIIRSLDTHLLKHNVTKLYAQSKTIQERLKKWGKIPSEVLYPPPPQRNYRTEGYENFIFSVSRLQKLKRLDLFVEAFKYVKNKDLKGVIIGSGPEEKNLLRLINESGLDSRITLLGTTEEDSVLSHYARCLAVFFAPLREDYGFVTGEAFASRKAVVTTTDSGGPAELVGHQNTGYILENKPQIIAQKLDELAENKNLAEKMGQKAYEFISNLTWEKAVKKLVII